MQIKVRKKEKEAANKAKSSNKRLAFLFIAQNGKFGYYGHSHKMDFL